MSRVAVVSTLATTATALKMETLKGFAQGAENLMNHGTIFPDEDENATGEYYQEQADSKEDIAALDLMKIHVDDTIFAEIRDLVKPDVLANCQGTVIETDGHVLVEWTGDNLTMCTDSEIVPNELALWTFEEKMKPDEYKVVLRREKTPMRDATADAKEYVSGKFVDSMVYGMESLKNLMFKYRKAIAVKDAGAGALKTQFLQFTETFLNSSVAAMEKMGAADAQTLESLRESVALMLKNDATLTGVWEQSNSTKESIDKEAKDVNNVFAFYWENHDEIKEMFHYMRMGMHKQDDMVRRAFRLMKKFVDQTQSANLKMFDDMTEDAAVKMFNEMNVDMEKMAAAMKTVMSDPSANPMDALAGLNLPSMEGLSEMMEKMGGSPAMQQEMENMMKQMGSPEMQEQMKNIMDDMDTPEMQKKMQEMEKQFKNEFKQLGNQASFNDATTQMKNLFNNEAMKEQMEKMQKQMETPEFKKQMEDMQKMFM